MKTALKFKSILALILLPAFVLASNGTIKGKYKKQKTYHEEFSVNSDALVKIKNSYGNLDIVTWTENRVVIDVTITTSGNNEEKVERKLEDIYVEFENNSSLVYAKTRFSKSGKSWWSWGNNNVNMNINYVVKMPITNNVDLSNDYGSINLDKLEGHAKIDCDYGKITTKELMAENNDINFDYTSNSYFEYINSGSINADYSGFTVGQTKNLDVNADYTNSKIEIAENVSYKCDYGSIGIDKVNSVSGNGDYLTVKIGDVYKNVTISADYGSLKIKNMTANAGSINIESDYMKSTIGYSPGYSFNFNIDLDYASLNNADDFNFTTKNSKSSSKKYIGYYGDANSTNNILINSDYGSVTFKRN
ncbi:MAG: hypothetical protein HKO92_04535 [Flavobacteriaceae bacterium]|nr:hypothetical protein [Flavobacteriaceae bacterium]